jgi:hypothetical protein
MTKPFTKAQSNQIAEKTAIIANTAFGLGVDAANSKTITYIKGQTCTEYQETKKCEHDNCYLLGDIIAYINQEGKHAKNEIGLTDATTN